MKKQKKTSIGFIFLSLFSYSHLAFAHHPGGSGSGTQAGGIYTINANTLNANQWLLNFSYQYIDFKAFSDETMLAIPPDEEDIHSLSGISVPAVNISYGITNNLMLSVNFPYIIRTDIKHRSHAEHHVDLAHETELEILHLGDSKGFGDVNITSEWRFLNCPNRYAVATLLGLNMATGQTGITDDFGELFETEHQPGSGAWNPSFGLASSVWPNKALEIDANVLYTKATTGSQHTNLGDFWNYNLSFSQSLLRDPRPKETLLAILEFNGVHENRIKRNIGVDNNSGGNIIYLSPGVKYLYQRFSPYVSFGIPIYQQINGYHPKITCRVLAGFSVLI